MLQGFRNPHREGEASLRILLTDTNRCPFVPRLAIRFEKLGAELAVLCPASDNPARSLRNRVRIFPYSGFHPVASLRKAIESFNPDIVISGCDRSIQHLHELHAICKAEGGAALSISTLIERSLGSTDSFSIVSSRHALLRVAMEEGVRVPKLMAINDLPDIDRLTAEFPLPWVIKADGTWGGRGVRFVHGLAEAEKCFHELTDKRGAGEFVKSMSLNRDRDWVYLEWSRPRPAVIAQSFIHGRPANCAVVCHEGELLAGIAVEVVQSRSPTGPASIVQVVEGQEMIQAAQRLARRLRLSGFFGLDFVIEESTGATYLIEMNPRCTPPCPLPLDEGRDLVAAFWSHLHNQPVTSPDTSEVAASKRIVYFPQPAPGADDVPDSLLSSSYLDIPVDEPILARELSNLRPLRSLAGQLIDGLRMRLSRKGSPQTVVFQGAITPQPVATAEPDNVAIRS